MISILDKHIIDSILMGTFSGDIFSIFGMHQSFDDENRSYICVRAFQPEATLITVVRKDTKEELPMNVVHSGGFFQLDVQSDDFFPYYYKVTLKKSRNNP